MTKRYLPFLFAGTLLIGGCGTMKMNDNPDTNSTTNAKVEEVQTAALQDSFTKEFIPSTEEVEEGYYTFESRVGGYTMLYPVNAVMDQTYYQYRSTQYEAFYFGESIDDENKSYYMQGTFEDKKSTSRVDTYLDLLAGTTGVKPKDFEHYEINGNDVYFAQDIHDINKEENKFFYNFLGFVKSKESNKAIRIVYGASCKNKEKECSLDMESEKEKMKKMIDSIRFKP